MSFYYCGSLQFDIAMNKNIDELVFKYLQHTLSEEERRMLDSWINQSVANRARFEEWTDSQRMEEKIRRIAAINREKGWQRIVKTRILDESNKQYKPVVAVRHKVRFRYWVAAASFILAIATTTALIIYSDREVQYPGQTVATNPADVAPGKNGAILTLADGSQVVLDSMGNGVVAMQNGAQILLQNSGLTYIPEGRTTGEIAYNTMTTPNGRQFQLALPDGTRAWLNAASSITFPTVFSGNERSVRIAGEVYLEVAKNATMPFRVNVDGKAQIEVLGTHFNVNAYANESTINMMLLEGSIRVSNGNGKATLKPGQRAEMVNPGKAQVIPATSEIKVRNDADINRSIAWKDGIFDFQGLTLGAVLRQIERWYDIRVHCNETSSGLIFGGKMYKNVSLADVLDMLKDMGVKYEWDGNVLTIL